MAYGKDTQAIAEAITQVVSSAIFAMVTSGLDQDDLNHFRQYVERQHSIGSLLDPTAYRDVLQSNGFERISARLKLLDQLVELTASEMKHFDQDKQS